jgi:hypothetical protein
MGKILNEKAPAKPTKETANLVKNTILEEPKKEEAKKSGESGNNIQCSIPRESPTAKLPLNLLYESNLNTARNADARKLLPKIESPVKM